jgi:hypothetical protein
MRKPFSRYSTGILFAANRVGFSLPLPDKSERTSRKPRKVPELRPHAHYQSVLPDKDNAEYIYNSPDKHFQ